MGNRDRREKRFNHKLLISKCKELLFNENEKKYYCPTPGCSTESSFKGNVVRHMKDCVQQKIQKEKKTYNKKCQFCGKTFAQKPNRDHQVRNRHSSEMSCDTSDIVPTFISELGSQPGSLNQPLVSVSDIDIHNALPSPSEMLNVYFLTDDGGRWRQ